MTLLNIVTAPNHIFKTKADVVELFDNSLKETVDNMLQTMYFEKAIGLGANMVGILKRIIVVDLMIDDKKDPIVMINPEIVEYSKEMQSFEEASLSYPGISAQITRSKTIKVKYQDIDGNHHENNYEDFLSTVLQHEIDYLDGKVYLDYLSKLKRDILLKKMEKFKEHMKNHHVHGPNCNH